MKVTYFGDLRESHIASMLGNVRSKSTSTSMEATTSIKFVAISMGANAISMEVKE